MSRTVVSTCYGRPWEVLLPLEVSGLLCFLWSMSDVLYQHMCIPCAVTEYAVANLSYV